MTVAESPAQVQSLSKLQVSTANFTDYPQNGLDSNKVDTTNLILNIIKADTSCEKQSTSEA